jgi:plasmid stabilization system protein ParE
MQYSSWRKSWYRAVPGGTHRFFLVYSYLIAYRHETKPLQIIRILYAARDAQGVLGLARDDL